jgi:branched-chain amino acid transport system ATP-binding protein
VLNLFPRLKGYMPRAAGTLSGGERQMLAESMVLMRDPKIMLVDEPTAGLMPKLVTDVLRKLREMAETTGLPVVVVEQRARRALELGDYAYMMRGGRFTFEGDSEELLNHPQLTEMYLGAVEIHDLKTIRE